MAPSYNYEVIVIGAGPAGSLAAAEVARAGKRVLIVEKDTEVGIPEHCGGLVSTSGLKNVIDDYRIIKKKIDKGTLIVKDRFFDFSFEKSNLVEIDRQLLDKKLAGLAIKEGSDMVLGSYAFYKKENNVNLVYIKGKKLSAKYVINAGGNAYYPKKEGKILATQFMFALKNGNYDGIAVYINKELIPKMFGWYIPYEEGLAKVGAPGSPEIALLVAKKILNNLNLNGEPIKIMSSYLINGGPVFKDNTNDYVLVGDAGGQTKPTTGGGIIFGGIGGKIAGKLAAKDALDKYNEEYYKRGPGRDLINQVKIKDVYDALNDSTIYKIVEVLHEKNASFSGDEFDFHSKFIRRVLEDPLLAFKIAEVIPSAVFSYLKSLFFS
ncbi:MAG: FAD-dependent oxidoreductase [Nitrososphaeria archaeon]